ncbi:uncharacterized protein N0V89_004787 [Didymosphaeria variabile]|uniref:DUF7820 domain-containing protein n=1 Tax=Didymosphaeria variabile TaxID=1932322 RepID=A0A9W8XSH2_9PLEO|nr:uncharacterized protein N0V89_004787 [Didymosphaeria variabile]KAJ4356751.1 hypothetical protein N0V89_004787 [Didymosphaeria variabile]
MRFSRRSPKNIPIPTLPSILTFFPVDDKQPLGKAPTNERVESGIGYGLEVVPIERCNTSCGKTVSPDHEQKEVLYTSLTHVNTQTKPLPPLPKAAWKVSAKGKWYRLSVKRRIFVLLCVQFGLLLIICLSLLSIKPRLTKRDPSEASDGSVTSPGLPLGPTIPDGPFVVKLNTPRQQSSACLADSDDADAWTCTSDAVLQIAASSSESPLNQPTLSIRSTNSTDPNRYGEQALSIIALQFDETYATAHSGEEPIYRFEALYDRTVLLTAAQLSFLGPSEQNAGRAIRATTSPDDKPWLCHFNNTIMEIFVYVSQHAAAPDNSTYSAKDNSTNATPQTPFPYVVQMSEIYGPNGTRAYCEQQSVSDRGDLRKSDAPKYFLSTADTSKIYDSHADSDQKAQANMAESACQCQWIVQ